MDIPLTESTSVPAPFLIMRQIIRVSEKVEHTHWLWFEDVLVLLKEMKLTTFLLGMELGDISYAVFFSLGHIFPN